LPTLPNWMCPPETTDAARENIRAAVRGFLETADEQGTLPDILEEAGYRRDGDRWLEPEFVSVDRMAVGLG